MNPGPAVVEALVSIAGPGRVHVDAALSRYTTFGVGGPADCLVEVGDSEQVVQVARLAHGAGLPLTILGGGSNTVVADAGVRGLVLRLHGGRIAAEERPVPDVLPGGTGRLVRADAGVTMNALVRWTIGRALAGLEAWAGQSSATRTTRGTT